MLGKMIAVVALALTLTACQTAPNQPTDAFVKHTLETNKTTMAPRVSPESSGQYPAAPNT
jgi:starvation-inducible outer membrane lipoprotein